VTNDHDRRLFQEIRKQAGCFSDCGVFQMRASSRYNVPPPPNFDGIETVASVLKIENELVFNCLVDNVRIDQNALARDKNLSEECLLVQNGQNLKIRDSNITAVYCLPRGDQWTVKNGSLAMFSNEKKFRQTIGVDKSAALEAAKHEESLLQEEHAISRKEEAKLDSEHTKHQREWNVAKRSMQMNDATISDLSAKIDEIKSEIETSANVTIDTTEYEDDVREAEEAIETLRESEEKISAQLEDALPTIDDLKSRVDDCNMRNLKVLEDIEAAEKDLTQLLESHTQQKDNLEKKRQKIVKYREIMKKYQEKVDESRVESEKSILKARKLTFRLQILQTFSQDEMRNEVSQDDIQCDPTDEELDAIKPMENEHEPQYYEVRVNKLKKKLDTERQRRKICKEDALVAYEKYIRAKNDITEKTKQVIDAQAHIESLSNDLKERKRRWKQFRSHLSRATNMKFSEMLSINDYAGELSFSHDDKTLDLGVQKNSSQTNGISKDIKSLRYVHCVAKV
jgi:structural maintenance of chromosomes protein 6